MTRRPDDTSRPRGRPLKSAAELDEMRLLIATTAQQLFQEEGYLRVSIRRLAKEVGCSPMTLYKYYDGKISILQTLWAVVFRDLFDRMEQVLANETDPKARLLTACQHYVGYWLDSPEHYRLVFMAEGVTQPEVSLFIDNNQAIEGFNLLRDAVSEALPHDDEQMLKLKVDVMMGALHGIAHNQITISGYDWSDADAIVEHLVENLTRSSD